MGVLLHVWGLQDGTIKAIHIDYLIKRECNNPVSKTLTVLFMRYNTGSIRLNLTLVVLSLRAVLQTCVQHMSYSPNSFRDVM